MRAALPQEIGTAGIFGSHEHSSRDRRRASFFAGQPGVSGSPTSLLMYMTEPRCTPQLGRYGPFGIGSPLR